VEPGNLDVGDIIDRCPVGRLQKLTVALCCLVAMLDGFDAQSIGFLAPPIAASLGTDVRAFGPMFSASLVGIMIGALVIGPAGDRWGRKRMVILATVSFGIFAFATAFARNLQDLVIVRFLTGLGLGGALPNVVALATDYVPQRLKTLPACFISAAMPAGGMLAGIAAAWLLPEWGWRAVFYVGGVVPIGIAVVCLFALPESVRLLCIKGADGLQIRAIMAQIWPDSRHMRVRFVASVEKSERAPLLELFRHGRAVVTVALWLAFFTNLLVIYTVISWMPALLTASSLSVSAGIMAITAFSLGAIFGSLLQGPLLARLRPSWVFAIEFGLFVLLVLLLSAMPLSQPLVGMMAFAIGWVIQGAQAGLNALAANFYPPALRATGLGWGLGIGRIGSIVGPLLAGWALQAAWSPRHIFMAGSVPAVCAAVAILIAIAGGAARTDECRTVSAPAAPEPR